MNKDVKLKRETMFVGMLTMNSLFGKLPSRTRIKDLRVKIMSKWLGTALYQNTHKTLL